MGGYTLQGELGSWGIRSEGNSRRDRVTGLLTNTAAGGVDRRLSPKLTMQFEQFYNGAGYGNPNDYSNVTTNPNLSQRPDRAQLLGSGRTL